MLHKCISTLIRGWAAGWMDGWMGCIEVLVGGEMDGRMHGCTDECVYLSLVT